MLLELENISKSYPGPQQAQRVLEGVNLSVAAGDFVGITGASGSGKSTLLNIISFLDVPSGGQVIFEGETVAWQDRQVLRRHRREYLGMVFQQFNLLTRRTVRENILFRYRYLPRKSVPRDLNDRADVLMTRLGIAEFADKPVRLLSGGEMQRVAIARALIHRPRMLVADEPTGNLDQQSAQQFMEILQDFNREGLTILLVTHNPALLDYCTRHIGYEDGRFVEKELPR